MAIYPGAVFKPTSFGGRTKRNKQGRGILHVAVSNARSLAPWNQNTWHFYVAHDGYCEQYVDTEFRAYASADANDDALQIETAGGMGSSKVLNAERWTPAAAARLADIMRWARDTEGIPLDLLPDSKAGRRGWGPHRLGVKHSSGSRPGWWQIGGEVWSSVVGKECPGDAKVAQIPELLAAARGGAPQLSEADMPLNRADAELIYSTVTNVIFDVTSGASDASDDLRGFIAASVSPQVAALQGRVDGLSEALRQVAAAPGAAIDLAAVQAAAKAGTAEAIKAIDVTVRAT